MKRFGVMLDMSRDAVMKPQQIKKFADVIKSFGYNMIQLYTEDTYEVENEPYFGYMRGRYSIEELKDIASYCNAIGIEIIPCIQTLAHLNQIFRWCEYTNIQDTGDILLAEDERTYKLIDNMFKSIRRWCTSKYIHIGMDEAHMLGLGKYLDKHGYKNRFEILDTHLKMVMKIAAKYDFKPIMWSDMFIKLGNHGNYYSEDIHIPDDVIKHTPNDVELVYWDYYHDDKKVYDRMFDAHSRFSNEIWFAGGTWTWSGFAPNNKISIDRMIPAMESAKEHGIENIFMTMWGDNGKECSFYSVLPSLYTVRRIYDGETDIDKIKIEFEQITGENYDHMIALDYPNCIGGNFELNNVCKHMLYADPFVGALDATVNINNAADYKRFSNMLADYAAESKSYGYIFEEASSLCNVLSVKYTLGLDTRMAYQTGDKDKVRRLLERYDYVIEALNDFYNKFETLWYNENKPFGFEVHDARLGGLIHRIRSCRKRLEKYCDGKLESIPELEERLLDWFGDEENLQMKPPYLNNWSMIISPNVV